jgi:hypothetical protein
MTFRFRTATLIILAATSLSACAVRLGGAKPETYDTIVLSAAANADATQTAQRIVDAGAELVFISADRDSAWLESVATAVKLKLSGPGRTSGRSLAFMTNLEVLGDTSLVLNVPGGGKVHMHDALLKVDKTRNLDMMMVRFDAPDVRAATNTLLGYIATDVGGDAALLIAIDGPTVQVADSVATLMRATLTTSLECARGNPSDGAGIPLRLLYGPSAQLTCLSARVLTGPPAALAARVQVER